MGKSKPTVQQTTIDPGTQAALDEYRKRAMANAGTGDAQGQAQYAAGTANLGFGSQTGLGNIGDYYDPYEKDVIGGLQSDFNQQRGYATNAAADQATKAGAFGGSRSAVLQSNLLSDVNRNEATTLAGVRSSGFNDAAMRLMADRERTANLGFGQQQAGWGQQQGGLQGILASLGYGNTSTSTQAPTDPWGNVKNIAGLAATGYGIYSDARNKGKKPVTTGTLYRPGGGYYG